MKEDVHGGRIKELALSFEISDFIFFKQSFNTFGQWGNNGILVSLSLPPIHIHTAEFDTHCLEIVISFVHFMRDIEQSFGRNATYVQASST